MLIKLTPVVNILHAHFFVRKCFAQLFSSFVIFCAKMLVQKDLVKCWWNWHLVSKGVRDRLVVLFVVRYFRCEWCGRFVREASKTEFIVWSQLFNLISDGARGVHQICLRRDIQASIVICYWRCFTCPPTLFGSLYFSYFHMIQNWHGFNPISI